MSALPLPSPGEALTRIRSLAERLIPSERRVADVLLAQPEAVLGWSVADLARVAETSTATVVRACKSLGFSGYPQMRMALARELPDVRSGAGQHEQSDSPPAVAASVFSTAIDSLRLGIDMLDDDQLQRAVDALTDARRLLFVGTGASAAPVQDAALRFICAGRPTEAPADVVTQQLTARLLGPEDACLAVSHSGANGPTLTAALAARAAGAVTIGITSYPSSALVDAVDIPLVVGTAVNAAGYDVVTGRISHLLLLHALQVCVALRQPEVSEAARVKVEEVLGGITAELPRGRSGRWTM
jgi:DNA-binding MurR/RpiR family transcriptional regulator